MIWFYFSGLLKQTTSRVGLAVFLRLQGVSVLVFFGWPCSPDAVDPCKLQNEENCKLPKTNFSILRFLKTASC